MKKAGHTHTHAPNAVIHSDPRTTQSSVVHPLQGAGRNPRERGRSLMPSNNLIRTFCGQEDERSTNRRRRKTHEQREAPRQRAGIWNSGTQMGDKHTHVNSHHKQRYQENHTSPTQIICISGPTRLGTYPVATDRTSVPPVRLFHNDGGMALPNICSMEQYPTPSSKPRPSQRGGGLVFALCVFGVGWLVGENF